MSTDVSESGYIILKRVKITGTHKPTGKTTHYSGGKILPPPSELQIAQYPGDDGYYLFYLDENGQEMTDTFHDNIQSAMEQAKWEFEVKPSEWEEVK